MKSKIYTVHSLLSKVLHNNLDRKEINFLIDKSYRKSIAIVRSKYSNHFSSRDYDKEEMENIAMDAIVSLFVVDKNGEYGISRSIKRWKHTIDSEVESEYFLFNVISKRVEHTVTTYFKQKDPLFEKILNTLNVCISNSNFKKARFLGSIYILDEYTKKIEGKLIPPDEFDSIPEKYFKLKQKKLFDKIFEHIRKKEKYCSAIPLNMLVNRVKSFYIRAQSLESKDEQCLSTGFIFEELVNVGLNSVKDKLESHYVASNIICERESFMIYEAFKNISSDMLNIGAYDKLYRYLNDYDETITKEVYYLKYRNIMKYLLLELKLKIGQNFQ